MAFCDIKMPGWSGWEFVDWFRRRPELADIVIAVMSGGNLASDKAQALAAGAHAYVPKFRPPVGMASLIATAMT